MTQPTLTTKTTTRGNPSYTNLAVGGRAPQVQITDTDDAGCGRWFPRFHPKNALPLAHNNDANAPFYDAQHGVCE